MIFLQILQGQCKEIGLGESYMEDLWDSEDLTTLLELFIENRKALKEGNTSLAAFWKRRSARRFELFSRRPGSQE